MSLGRFDWQTVDARSWRMRWAVSAIAALGFLASTGHAVPVQIGLDQGSQGGFGFSFLHDATTSCSVIGGVEFCQNGSSLLQIDGTLTADLTGQVLSGISGTLTIQGGGNIIVTGGTIDYASSAPDTFGGFLTTSTHGTFHFLDHSFLGPANSFDGTTLSSWGNNWNTGNPGDPTPFARFGIDLGGTVTPVPEPAWLSLLGALAVTALRRRG